VEAVLAVSQMTTYRQSFLEDVAACERTGIGALAVWRPKLVDFGEERSLELIRDAGLRVSSLNWAGGFTGSHGYSFLEAVRDTREAIVTAAELGAGVLTLVSGARGGHIVSHAQRLLMLGLEETLDFAAEHGVVLALQPMHWSFRNEWTFLHSLDETLKLLALFEHPYLKMALGTYHLGEQPDLLERLPEAVPYLASVQLSDWDGTPRTDQDHCLPGDGCLPLSEIIAVLEESGYQGDYEIDVWSPRVWRMDPEPLLTSCRERFRRLFPAWANSLSPVE
jgi:sugar phosphate isomerase/epimerase